MLDYLPDVESDFSVFHRVDNIYTLSAARFTEWAVRLSMYEGAIAGRAAHERRQQGGNNGPVADQVTVRPDISADVELADLVEYERI